LQDKLDKPLKADNVEPLLQEIEDAQKFEDEDQWKCGRELVTFLI